MISIRPIIPALFLVLLASYYSQNYAGILASTLGSGLIIGMCMYVCVCVCVCMCMYGYVHMCVCACACVETWKPSKVMIIAVVLATLPGAYAAAGLITLVSMQLCHDNCQ